MMEEKINNNEVSVLESGIEDEKSPESGHGRIPWFILMIWTVNVLFYIYYFMRYGVPNLQQWLEK